MGRRNDLLVERAQEHRKLSDAKMDWCNAQADIKSILNPTTIEDPSQEVWDEYMAAHRRLCTAWDQMQMSRRRLAAIEKELE